MPDILGKAKTVGELLKGVKYSIDYYQREYKWQDKQIRELIDDLSGKFLEEYQPEHPRSKVADYPHATKPDHWDDDPPDYPHEAVQSVWTELQRELVGLRPNARHVFAAASHYVHEGDPDLVVSEISRMREELLDFRS